ncbi:hypothetical protein [Streptococcus pneumoniae]|uniref:hypothetical protein n=1 Tax=Streptococcus pneumoniae TaxID=1313 RepID=UPI0015DB196B|nr:hypothetical protein [Streptococcus pneumoniae]
MDTSDAVSSKHCFVYLDTSDAVSSKLAVGCSKHCFEVVIHLTQSVTYLRQGDVDAV